VLFHQPLSALDKHALGPGLHHAPVGESRKQLAQLDEGPLGVEVSAAKYLEYVVWRVESPVNRSSGACPLSGEAEEPALPPTLGEVPETAGGVLVRRVERDLGRGGG